MKIIIFAGGSGRRLWPISRQKSPKQFEPIIGSESTLQLAVGRVLDTYGAENIFISTNEKYLPLVQEQLPQLPEQNNRSGQQRQSRDRFGPRLPGTG